MALNTRNFLDAQDQRAPAGSVFNCCNCGTVRHRNGFCFENPTALESRYFAGI